MKTAKIGCFFIYSILLIIIGMALYKYRVEVINYLSAKYEQTVSYVKQHTSEAVSEIKDN